MQGFTHNVFLAAIWCPFAILISYHGMQIEKETREKPDDRRFFFWVLVLASIALFFGAYAVGGLVHNSYPKVFSATDKAALVTAGLVALVTLGRLAWTIHAQIYSHYPAQIQESAKRFSIVTQILWSALLMFGALLLTDFSRLIVLIGSALALASIFVGLAMARKRPEHREWLKWDKNRERPRGT